MNGESFQFIISEINISFTEGTVCNTLCGLFGWNAWQNCSESCGGGIRLRKRNVCCPSGSDLQDCLSGACNGTVEYDDTWQKSLCNSICYNGGYYNETCLCQQGWTGRCCESRM